jgi:hypothetical protein
MSRIYRGEVDTIEVSAALLFAGYALFMSALVLSYLRPS